MAFFQLRNFLTLFLQLGFRFSDDYSRLLQFTFVLLLFLLGLKLKRLVPLADLGSLFDNLLKLIAKLGYLGCKLSLTSITSFKRILLDSLHRFTEHSNLGFQACRVV